jgi:hypothetical protein
MTMKSAPMLEGCDVLPPMESGEPRQPAADQPIPRKQKPGQGKAASRFIVLNSFVDCTAGGLPRSELLVWLVLYRDTRNGVAETSQVDIARRCGISDRTVRRAIGRLERRKLVKVVFRGGLDRGPSKYRVLPLE